MNYENEKTSTRDHLLHAAGELFAAHGLDGVTTRMIADEAGVKLSGIHYHFGSKEKLYLAALEHAMNSDVCANFASVIDENPALLESSAGCAEIIRNTVFRSFYDRFKGDSPDWTTQLLVREIIKPSRIFEKNADIMFAPDKEAARNLYFRCRSDAEESHFFGWMDLLHSQIFLYVMAKDALEIMRGKGSMNLDFYRCVARVVARSMILDLELPLPEDLK